MATSQLLLLTGVGIGGAVGWLLHHALRGSRDWLRVDGSGRRAVRVGDHAVSFADLVRREERFRAIADYTYDLELLVGSDGRLQWANPAFFEAVGFSWQDLDGQPDFPMSIIDPADRPAMGELYQGALDGSRGNDVEFRLLLADGSANWYAISWQSITDREGRRLGVRASLRDIAARKALDQEREQLLSRLQEALDQVRTLRGLLPICARCKKIRNETDQWQQIEQYVTEHSEAMFSHGLCPECARDAFREAGVDPPGAPTD